MIADSSTQISIVARNIKASVSGGVMLLFGCMLQVVTIKKKSERCAKTNIVNEKDDGNQDEQRKDDFEQCPHFRTPLDQQILGDQQTQL